MSFEIVIEDREVVALLREKEFKLSQPGIAAFLLGRAAYWLQQRARDRFESEGDDASGEWEDLKEYTYKMREDKGFVPIKINNRTGSLRAWVTNSDGDLLSTEPVSQLTWPGEAPVGELAKKMRTAQQGTQYPETVARPVVAMNEQDLIAIMGFLSSYVMEPGMVPLAAAA